MREHGERLGQFFSRKRRCRSPHRDCLRHSNAEILRLLDQARGSHFVCFRRINHVEAEDVFVRANAHVKAVAVVRRVRDLSAIVQHNPVFRFRASTKFDSLDPNDGKNSYYDCASQCLNSRCRELTSGKSAPHQDCCFSSPAKRAAYVATSAPKTLPAMTSLTK